MRNAPSKLVEALRAGKPVSVVDLMGKATVSLTRQGIRVTFDGKSGQTFRRFDTAQGAVMWALDAVKGRPCL
jgi:hypothetical protein